MCVCVCVCVCVCRRCVCVCVCVCVQAVYMCVCVCAGGVCVCVCVCRRCVCVYPLTLLWISATPDCSGCGSGCHGEGSREILPTHIKRRLRCLTVALYGLVLMAVPQSLSLLNLSGNRFQNLFHLLFCTMSSVLFDGTHWREGEREGGMEGGGGREGDI